MKELKRQSGNVTKLVERKLLTSFPQNTANLACDCRKDGGREGRGTRRSEEERVEGKAAKDWVASDRGWMVRREVGKTRGSACPEMEKSVPRNRTHKSKRNYINTC